MIVLPCAFFLYALGVWRYEDVFARGWPLARTGAFIAALVTLGLALGAFDAQADRWFSAHMLQHLALIFIAAPLLLWSAPYLLASATLPVRVVRPWMRLLRFPLVRALLSPPVCWVALGGLPWIAHFSPLYEAALENEKIHWCEHALFLGAAMLFWSPVIAVGPAPWRLSPGARIAYLFTAMPPNAFLGVSLYACNHVLYPHYADVAGRGIEETLADQHAGAALMWILGSLSMLASVLAAVAWWGRDERAIGSASIAGIVFTLLVAVPSAVHAAGDARLTQRGAQLYGDHCASCHGEHLEGSVDGPPLIGVNAEAVDFYLSTGRMPLAVSGVEPMRDRPYFSSADIAALVSYVTLHSGGSRALPHVQFEADLVRGRKIYEENCQACHGAVPSLMHTPAMQIAEAVRVGPGVMPLFNDRTIPQRDLNALVRYVNVLQTAPDDRGGLPLGNLGPVSEGFIAWLAGTGALIGLIRFIGTSVGEET